MNSYNTLQSTHPESCASSLGIDAETSSRAAVVVVAPTVLEEEGDVIAAGSSTSTSTFDPSESCNKAALSSLPFIISYYGERLFVVVHNNERTSLLLSCLDHSNER
mmetsp:Transcript_20875/g.31502  ORF Transcript_20875/g.31502 Transcript_20875/m.31502 type:complete len:106 (+) Transcript_20875:672-989(+)